MKTENTPQTASEKAEVMLAFDRGEQVEIRHRDSAIWGRAYSPTWDWHHSEWRVMAKPIECWIWVHPNGTRSSRCYDSKLAAEDVYKHCAGRVVFMREAI